jgi:hypothetical protein
MESTKKTTTTTNKNWKELINESVHTSDDVDIGDIYAVNKNFIVVKRGFVNIHYYYIPTFHVEGWDGKVLWLKINEETANSKYQRNDSYPDPYRYYLKDRPLYHKNDLSEVMTISSKIAEPAYSFEYPVTTKENNDDDVKNTDQNFSKDNVKFKCDLCNKTNFNSEEELSNHIKSNH